MIRKILSVISGYAIFVSGSLVFFRISGQNPHAPASTLFIALTAACGIVFSVAAGWITKTVASVKELKMNYFLAAVIAGFATFSFFKADGSSWSQLLAIFIFAPASLMGGVLQSGGKK